MISFEIYAHQPSVTTDGVKVHWSNSTVPIQINSQNSDLSTSSSYQIIKESMAAWNSYSPVFLKDTTSSSNQIKFSSSPAYFGSGVLGVTLVNYSATTGTISNAQIILNQTALFTQRFFQFIEEPDQTDAFSVFLGDVVTHEVGHLLGLSHSEVLDSSMIYTVFKGQASIAADDISGLRAIYSSGSFGSISGVIKGGKDIPIFGAHVLAISLKNGKVSGSIFSKQDGSFSIKGLDLDDTYFIYVTPAKKISSLIESLASVQSNYCPGSYIGSFFEACSSGSAGKPQAIKLDVTNKNRDVGVVTIRCDLRVNSDYLKEKYINQSFGVYSFDDSSSITGDVFVGSFLDPDLSEVDFDDSQYDQFNLNFDNFDTTIGDYYLDIKVVSESLGTSLDYEIVVSGPTPTQTYHSTTDPITDKKNLDQIIRFPMSNISALNVFTVVLKPKKISSSLLDDYFPSPDLFVSKRHGYLLTASVVKKIGNEYNLVGHKTQSTIFNNNSCLDAPFAYQVKANTLSQATIQEARSAQEEVEQAPTACGTINSSGGPKAGGNMLVGFMASFLLFFLKTRKKLLS